MHMASRLQRGGGSGSSGNGSKAASASGADRTQIKATDGEVAAASARPNETAVPVVQTKAAATSKPPTRKVAPGNANGPQPHVKGKKQKVKRQPKRPAGPVINPAPPTKQQQLQQLLKSRNQIKKQRTRKGGMVTIPSTFGRDVQGANALDVLRSKLGRR